jgi:hypothetical protein
VRALRAGGGESMPSTYAPLSTGHTNSYAPVLGPNANGGTWSSNLRSKKAGTDTHAFAEN